MREVFSTFNNPLRANSMSQQESNFIELSALAQRGTTIPATVFNIGKTDYEKPELFLGQTGGLLDTIHRPYPDLFRMYEELKAMDWKHNEFDYSRCLPEFKTCSQSIYRMMIRTLAWQWEGDSIAARTMADILLPMCTAAESRLMYCRMADNENLHALTYSEIVRSSFENPSTVLNEILSVRESHGRMLVVAQIVERARLASLEFQTTGVRTQEMEVAVVLLAGAVYLLERVQFMASFAVTFGIAELGLFEPIASAIQLIARDEYNMHVPLGEQIFKYVLATEWGQRAFAAARPALIQAIIELCRNELDWVDYLHSDGDELPGVTPQKLKDWTLFNARGVCVLFDVTKEVEAGLNLTLPSELPLSYMRDWIDINEKQSSPQEQDNNQYLINVVSTENVSDEKIDVGMDFNF